MITKLPLERLSHRARRVLRGWEISGVTRVTTGFPDHSEHGR